jgi:hypothetical protein
VARKEKAFGGVEIRPRVHGGAVPGVHLEVKVVVPLGVARVPAPGDLLAGRDLRAVRHRVRDARLAPALVLGGRGHVVVEMDIEVRRAALAVEVEHAAGAPGGRPPLDRPGLGGDDRGAPRDVLDVDPLVRALPAGVAVVHRVRVVADQREDDRLSRHEPGLLRGAGRGGNDEADEGGEDEETSPSCCRPVAVHGSGARREAPEPSRAFGRRRHP